MTAYQKLRNLLFPKSLIQEFAAACHKVDGLMKQGTNGEYAYLRILDIAEALRSELLPRGILLIPNDKEQWVEAWEEDGKRWTEVGVTTEFRLDNGRESRTFSSFGVGRDTGGKALYVAQTGALKAWLKRAGLIFGDRDDPEVEAKTAPQTQQEQDDELPRQKLAQARYQARAWTAALATCGRTEQEIEAVLSEAMGDSVSSADIVALDRAGFDVAMKLLVQHSDMTQVLEQSKRIAKRKKANGAPQPVVEALDHSDPQEIAGD